MFTYAKIFVAGATLLAGSLLPAVAQEPVVLRIYHSTSPTSTYARTIEFLGQRLQELTDGRVTVKEFGGGTLGTETTTLDLYETGDLDMGFHHTAAVSAAVRPLSFFDVPFLFNDADHWKRSIASEEGRAIIDGWIKDSGRPFSVAMMGLAGARNIYSKSKTFANIDDLQGFKIRVTESPITFKVWQALGMAPVGLPWNDVYSALESGLIDGTDNTPGWYVDARHSEVAKNWFWTRHLLGTQLVIISDEAVERVPEEFRDELRQALSEAEEWWAVEQVKFDQKAVDEQFDRQHVVQHEIPATLTQEIRKRVAPLTNEAAETLNAKVMLDLINSTRQGD